MTEPESGLWAELKRRRVVRVGIVYAIVAVGVVEAADLILPRLALPEWTVTLVVVLAVLGFPVAVALAWAFDVTPDGIRRAPGAAGARDTARGPVGLSRVQWTAGRIAVAAAVVILAVAGGGWFLGRDEPAPELDDNAVAVLPFRVSGADPSLSYLREGVVDLLASKLTGEAGPRAVNPRALLAAWRRAAGSDTEDLPPDEATRLARSLGAGKVLVGDVVGSAGAVTIRAELIDAATGGRTDAEQTGRAEELTVMVDRLAATLLALEAGEDRRRLDQLTTTSLPAMRAYLQGQVEYRQARFSEAADHFDRAVTEDSTFALAAMGLAAALEWYAQRPGRAEAYRLAWAHRDRLSDRDRQLLTALVGPDYPAPSSRADDLRALRRALDSSPDDPELWYRVGDVLYHTGAQLGIEDALDRSAVHFERALELDPDFAPVAEHLFILHIRRDAVDQALEIGHRYLAMEGAGAPAIQWLMRQLGDETVPPLRIADLDVAGMLRVAVWSLDGAFFVDSAEAAMRIVKERLLESGTPFQNQSVTLGMGLLELRRGRPAAAAETFSGDQIAHSAFTHPLLPLEISEPAARRLQAELPDMNAPQQMIAEIFLAHWALRQGDPARTRSLLTVLDTATAGGGSTAAMRDLGRLLLQAELAVHDGRPGAADRVRALDRAALEVPPAGFMLEHVNAALVGLHEQRGDTEAAHAAARRRGFTVGMTMFVPELLREEGRLAELLGRRDEAIEAYRTYLAFRSDPEPAIAREVEQVQAALQRLVGEGG